MDRNSPEREVKEKKHGKRIWVPVIEELVAEAESEIQVAASPCLGKVGKELAQEVAATAALEEEENEEEEENPDTHFKRKRRSPLLGASPLKKKKTVRLLS